MSERIPKAVVERVRDVMLQETNRMLSYEVAERIAIRLRLAAMRPQESEDGDE